MKKIGKVLGIVVAIFIVILLGSMIAIPISNDHIAEKTAESVKQIELPDNTEYVETFSKAGKLVGNGNGVQYLGGILIKSELTIEELKAYYSQYASNEWECIVEKQTDSNIQFIEHETVLLNAKLSSNNYIVYSWGEGDSVFCELDIRGH